MKPYILIISMFISLGLNAKQVEELKLYVFNTGELLTKDISVMFPEMKKGEQKLLATPTYLIKHPKGTLIWDAGFPDSIHTFPNGLDIWGGSWNIKLPKTLKSQLNEINIDPNSINFISFSHFHADHTGNGHLFKDATLLIQKDAFDAAFGKSPENLGYSPSDYSTFKKQTKLIENGYDVFGDGQVKIISTPGHASGHQILFINLKKYGPVILSGDLFVTKEQYNQKWIPVFNPDKEATKSSFAKIQSLIEETKATLWIQHEMEEFKLLNKSPLYYK